MFIRRSPLRTVIRSYLVLRFSERLAAAYANGGSLLGYTARSLLEYASIYIAPCVNPDGLDLVTGELNSGEYYNYAVKIAADYPRFAFPSDWKANIRGIDLNLQYPAGWEQARENKFAQGIVSPAPADYVGTAPLSAPESRAMYELTKRISPALTLSYHTQGGEIYWDYCRKAPPCAQKIAEDFASVSGYRVAEVPFDSSFAGKLGTYVVAVNHQLKEDWMNPTIGLLVCKGLNKVEAQYALESTSQPIGVSSYELSRLIPEEFKGSLPTIEEIEAELQGVGDTEVEQNGK